MLGGDCAACHATPFVRVRNDACMSCHRSVQHHVPIQSPAMQLFADRSCADCHQEHDAQRSLIAGNSSTCTQCHSELQRLLPGTSLRNVSDFATAHPPFVLAPTAPASMPIAPEVGTELASSNLTFSHKVHLDPVGVKTPQGRRTLSCGDCHQPDAAGRYMLPVRMEQHCAACHTLQFDEHDAASTVPHGNLPRLFQALQEHFSRSFLQNSASTADRRRPGGEQQLITREEQRRALDWATSQSLIVARELLEKRVCVQCHRVTRIDGAQGFGQWRIEPVRMAERWMPQAVFSHSAHATTPCTQCHHNADTSTDSEEVHMPSIADCRGCHGGDAPRDRIASPCLMCHQFHRAGRGLYTESPAIGNDHG
jgi:hypothetical protein